MTRLHHPRTVLGLVAVVTMLLLTACEEPVKTGNAGQHCPGPDGISADGNWVLTSPAEPGAVRLIGRGDAAGTARKIFDEGYGTAVDDTGDTVTAFSRRAGSGVIWRRATGEHTVLPRPRGTTVAIPTSISADGRHVGVTAAAVAGGPMSGHVYDAVTRTMTPIRGAESITQLVLNRSGRYAYVTGTDGVIRQIERTTGASRTIATASEHNREPIESVTRLGRLVVYNAGDGNRAGRPRIWDSNTGRSTTLPAPLRDGVAFDRIQISGDGKQLTATVFGSNGRSGEVIRLGRETGAVTSLAEVTEAGRPAISGDGSVTVYCRPDAGRRDLFATVENG